MLTWLQTPEAAGYGKRKAQPTCDGTYHPKRPKVDVEEDEDEEEDGGQKPY